MKKIMMLFVALVLTSLTFTSCCTTSAAAVTSVETVDDIYAGTTIDYTFIIANARPFYVDGVISYYFYNGIYYYPYVYNGVRCLHPYRYAQRRGYVHVPPRGYRPPRRWMHRDDRHHFYHQPNLPHHRPRIQPNRGGSSGFYNGNGRLQGKPNRSTHNIRSSTRVSTGHRNASSFNRGGSVRGRLQGGQRGGRR